MATIFFCFLSFAFFFSVSFLHHALFSYKGRQTKSCLNQNTIITIEKRDARAIPANFHEGQLGLWLAKQPTEGWLELLYWLFGQSEAELSPMKIGGKCSSIKGGGISMGLNSKVYFMVILRQLANLKISFIIAWVRIFHQLICKQLCKQCPQQETLTGRGGDDKKRYLDDL